MNLGRGATRWAGLDRTGHSVQSSRPAPPPVWTHDNPIAARADVFAGAYWISAVSSTFAVDTDASTATMAVQVIPAG